MANGKAMAPLILGCTLLREAWRESNEVFFDVVFRKNRGRCNSQTVVKNSPDLNSNKIPNDSPFTKQSRVCAWLLTRTHFYIICNCI